MVRSGAVLGPLSNDVGGGGEVPGPLSIDVGGRGGVQRFQNAAPSGDIGLIPFYRGTGTDDKGRTLEEILAWNDDRMEYVHDFIQWIFPTDEASKFNRHAPLLTADVVDVFLRDPEIRANLRRSFRRFLAFLGLEIRATAQPMTVDKAKNFNRRVPTCWQAFGFMGNHNWLRISRVLHCLGMVQMEEEQQAFMACLELLFQDGYPLDNAILHWRDRARGCGARRRKGNSSTSICAVC
uniref:Opioid growth factor receptor (OGFr) conserved domain-containing protein n=1 Tax=Alexandrium monilatum TaxID=311494 RepID=A0A7S4VBV3_9DINO|mmetsp:Transcript_49245/g.154711  ORF Transcript_49245/g.154711 Transcript_49245/m.154711 type:complete len:237 (-) Transcript_49245:76-786(-)